MTMAKAYWVATYRSISNPEALKALGKGADRDMRIVEGVD